VQEGSWPQEVNARREGERWENMAELNIEPAKKRAQGKVRIGGAVRQSSEGARRLRSFTVRKQGDDKFRHNLVVS
jgi:hypothetical protein